MRPGLDIEPFGLRLNHRLFANSDQGEFRYLNQEVHLTPDHDFKIFEYLQFS